MVVSYSEIEHAAMTLITDPCVATVRVREDAREAVLLAFICQ